METIYCYKLLFEHLTRLFSKRGKPLPGNYVTGTKEFSDKFIYHAQKNNIANKAALKHLGEKYYLPETYFPGEKVSHSAQDTLFFSKEIHTDNAEGLTLLRRSDIPPIVPRNYILQPVISSKLYHGRAFSLRVLVCVRRTGQLMIDKNFLYQVNPKVLAEKSTEILDKSLYVTNRAIHGGNGLGFFANDHPGEFDDKLYLDQLTDIIPNIFNKLLPISNDGYSDELSSSFFVAGLDFIARENDNQLLLLEINLSPGWTTIYGEQNYQRFYGHTTDFILNKEMKIDECIYI